MTDLLKSDRKHVSGLYAVVDALGGLSPTIWEQNEELVTLALHTVAEESLCAPFSDIQVDVHMASMSMLKLLDKGDSSAAFHVGMATLDKHGRQYGY